MPEREKRKNETVRAALFRDQPKPEKVGHNADQTFLVQRPNWSNLGRVEWQIVGSSEVFVDEDYRTAMERAVKVETGLEGLNFEEVGQYVNGEWLTQLFVALVEPQLVAQMVINFDKNQGAKWFDVGWVNGVGETELNEHGNMATHAKVAFDHNQMIKDSHQKLIPKA